MKFRGDIFLFCGAVLLVAGGAEALTLEEAARRVMAESPAIAQYRLARDAQKEGFSQAMGEFLPTASLSGSFTNKQLDYGTSQTNSHPRSFGLNISQPLFEGGANVAGYRAARNDLKAAEADFSNATQTTLMGLVTAYMNTLRDQEILHLQKSQVALLQNQLKATKVRFEQGNVTRTDVKQAEARLAAAAAAREQAEGGLASSRAALRSVLGEMPKTAEMNWPKVGHDAFPETLEDIRATALSLHPRVVKALAELSASKYRVSVSRAANYPSISASASLTHYEDSGATAATADYDDRRVSLNMTLPLFSGGKDLSDIREKKALRGKAEEVYEEARRLVEQELEESFHAHRTAQAAMKSYQKALEAEKLAVAGVEREAELGRRSVLDLLDARQAHLEAQVNVTTARRDVVVTGYRLLAAMGKLSTAF